MFGHGVLITGDGGVVKGGVRGGHHLQKILVHPASRDLIGLSMEVSAGLEDDDAIQRIL